MVNPECQGTLSWRSSRLCPSSNWVAFAWVELLDEILLGDPKKKNGLS